MSDLLQKLVKIKESHEQQANNMVHLLEQQLQQAQAKAERYKEIINLFKMAFTTGDAEHRTINGRSVQAMALLEEMEGEEK